MGAGVGTLLAVNFLLLYYWLFEPSEISGNSYIDSFGF